MSQPCGSPIPDDMLSDYWLGELSGADEQALEEHLLACDECSARLRSEAALAEGIARLGRQGNLLMIVSDAFIAEAASRGLRVRQYAPPAGGSVECTVTAADDYLVGRLAADLRNTQQLDVALCNAEGAEWMRLRDVPFHPQQKEVIFNQPIGMAKASGPDVLIVKLLSEEQGGERLIGQYRFNHTPSR